MSDLVGVMGRLRSEGWSVGGETDGRESGIVERGNGGTCSGGGIAGGGKLGGGGVRRRSRYWEPIQPARTPPALSVRFVGMVSVPQPFE